MKVNKTKWVKTTLGEVCDLYQPKTIAVKNLSLKGKYPVYGANGVIGRYDEFNHEQAEVLIGCRGTCGVVNISKPYSWINGNAMVVHPKKDEIFDREFLGHLAAAIDYSKVITGIAQPQITRANLKNVAILIPSLFEQQNIASELDVVQRMIDGYKAQVKDLGELAKSIFFEMFGDVSINEKCWKVTKLEKLGNLKNGLNYDKEETGNKIKVVGVGDFQSLLQLKDFSKIRTIELQKVLPDDYALMNGDIIFVRSNGNKKLVGRCMEVFPEEEVVTFGAFCIRFRKNDDSINNKYLIYLLTNAEFKKQHILKTNGIGIQSINQKILGDLPIPVPPFRLQQRFAAKIEAIEKQKELLRQQLSDAEMLMAERMQYYFS